MASRLQRLLLMVKSGKRCAAFAAALVGLIGMATTAFAQSTIGTTTSTRPFHSSTIFSTHCVNGYYWSVHHNGTTPELFSSSDGVSWTSRGDIFSFVIDVRNYAVRYLGDQIIAMGYNSGDTDRYYRNGTLNANGTVTWDAAELATGIVDSSNIDMNVLFHGNDKPIMWRASNGGRGTFWRSDQLNSPTTPFLVTDNGPPWGAATNGTFPGGAIFSTGGADPNDLIVLRASSDSVTTAGAHRLLAAKWDAGTDTFDGAWYNVSTLAGGIAESATTEVVEGGSSNHRRFGAVKDTSGNLHAVYVNRVNDVVHYKKDVGFNDSWSRLSTDVTIAAANVDRVSLTAVGSDNLYLFYSKSDEGIYYRRFDGTSWLGENTLKSNVTPLVGAISVMERSVGCALGIAWAEGAVSPYDVKFSLLADGSCTELRTTTGTDTYTVTAPGSFKMRFNRVLGGGIDELYDLELDPTVDLAGGISSHETLLIDEFQAGGNWYTNERGGATDQKLEPLEVTPTRVRIRVEDHYRQGSLRLRGLKVVGDYSVYPSGRFALKWHRKATVNVPYTLNDFELVVHYQGAGDLNNWSLYSESGTVPNANGTDIFVLSQIEEATAATDFLTIRDQPWAIADNVSPSTDLPDEALQNYWREGTGGTIPAGSEVFNFLTYFKPTSDFTNNADPDVTERRDDYTLPDVLSAIGPGSAWIDGDENTSAGDFYNESEAAYLLDADPSNGVQFDIDGNTTTRYRPFFKIRGWRSLAGPATVSLDGTLKANGIDYRTDLKPVARAHWAGNLILHSTLQAASTVTSPEVGSGGAILGSPGFPPARYGRGVLVNGSGEAVTFPQPSNMSLSAGAVEFWFKPGFDHDVASLQRIWAYSFDPTNVFALQSSSGGDLLFRIIKGGVATGTTVLWTNYEWYAGDWVHIRLTWNEFSGPGDQVRIFLNGVEPVNSDSGPLYSSAGMPAGGTIYVGNDTTLGNFADGIFDELRLYSNAGAPSSLAFGGLTSDPQEYFASGSRNFTLSFDPPDANGRGEYLYIGADSKFRGLNVMLTTPGVGTADLAWEYWNGTSWANLESFGFTDDTNHFTQTGTLYWTSDPTSWAVYSVNGETDLFYVRAHLDSGTYTTQPIEALIKTDILLFQYCADITIAAATFDINPPVPTAVELVSFDALSEPGGVRLTWETASELRNLGFSVYRATNEDGTHERVNTSAIPGLGSSPVGARYSFVDTAVETGATYFYWLEDIDASGKTTRHGPVSQRSNPSNAEIIATEPTIDYGDPDALAYRLSPIKNGVVIELTLDGFRAEVAEDGSVRLTVPGLTELAGDGASLPVLERWIDAVAGRKVKLVSVKARDVVSFEGLRPEAASELTLVASESGAVRARRRRARRGYRGRHLYPKRWAELLELAYQGESKRAHVRLSPFRWDGTRGELLMAKRLTVRVVFRGRDPKDSRRGGPKRSRGDIIARLATTDPGLYAVNLMQLPRARRMHLSRQGQPVAFHIDAGILYFVSDGARANPYGNEAVYELSKSDGVAMPVVSSAWSGDSVPYYWYTERAEENRLYQAGLVDAPDRWLWDVLFAPETKRFPFTVSELAAGAHSARVMLMLQGASDLPAKDDHHVEIAVNGTFVGETRWDGKAATRVAIEFPTGLLHEGENTLELANVGDTGAAYSMVMLDRFDVRYPRVPHAGSVVVELDDTPRWVSDHDGRFDPERDYLVTSVPYAPTVRHANATRLSSRKKRADYVVIGPRFLLAKAHPLLQHRKAQGLNVAAIPLEDIYEAFGHGETTPHAIRSFLTHAYHEWRKPSLRYVLLIGDGTYDYKNYLGTDAPNHVPPMMVRTSYLWTASDPAYAAVNGDDLLPDVAIGRLPARTEDELAVMIAKIIAYETNTSTAPGPHILVADNADIAGDFERNAEELSATVLSGYPQKKVYLSQLGTQAAREHTIAAFDDGAATMSYIGHGAIHLWADENFFNTRDIASLTTQSHQPLLFTMNCLNGYFHFPYFDSLAEALLKAQGRGAVAAFSPTGLSLDAPAHRFHGFLLEEVLRGGHARLGDAVLRAQERFTDSGAMPELLSIYHLFGDPALALRRN